MAEEEFDCQSRVEGEISVERDDLRFNYMQVESVSIIGTEGNPRDALLAQEIHRRQNRSPLCHWEPFCVCNVLYAIVMIVIASINIYIFSKRRDDICNYKNLINWNIAIIVISSIFLISICIIYQLHYKGYVAGRWKRIFIRFYLFWVIFGILALGVLSMHHLLCQDFGGSCFSADSMVYIQKSNNTQNIYKLPLRDLEIGDYVLTLDPVTNNVYFDEVLLRIHYEWYDNNNTYYPMRKLYLKNNVSITLSDDHFVFKWDNVTNKPQVIQSELIEIGDVLYYYDHNGTNQKKLIEVTDIEQNVMAQKRVFFTMSEYVLVDDIVASPFIGPHPIYHEILYRLFISNIFLIRNIWPSFMSSMFSFIGIFVMYGSYFIICHSYECCIIMVTMFIYKKWFQSE